MKTNQFIKQGHMRLQAQYTFYMRLQAQYTFLIYIYIRIIAYLPNFN